MYLFWVILVNPLMPLLSSMGGIYPCGRINIIKIFILSQKILPISSIGENSAPESFFTQPISWLKLSDHCHHKHFSKMAEDIQFHLKCMLECQNLCKVTNTSFILLKVFTPLLNFGIIVTSIRPSKPCADQYSEIIHDSSFRFSGQNNLTWNLCTVRLPYVFVFVFVFWTLVLKLCMSFTLKILSGPELRNYK